MNDLTFWSLIIILFIIGFAGSKPIQWYKYRLLYYKRIIWRAFGRCHRCGKKLDYTTKGRPICPNIYCR